MSNRNRRLSIDASYQVSVHLAKRFHRRRFFRNQPIRNKNSKINLIIKLSKQLQNNLLIDFLDTASGARLHLDTVATNFTDP